MPHIVYILACADHTLYTGYTNNLTKRLRAHNTNKSGAKYTRGRRPVTVVYSKNFRTHGAALSYEARVKKLSRPEKLTLISLSSPAHMSDTHLYTAYFHSPVGWLKITATELHLTGLHFVSRGGKSQTNPVLDKTKAQLQEYFAGARKKFDLPLVHDGTDFQKKIWHAINKIPFGKTISYQQLATKVGRPNAYRAAGTATGKNPICVIIPCHRVLTSSGELGGFSGPLQAKKILLELEDAAPNIISQRPQRKTASRHA